MTAENYYQILRVANDADVETIKCAYRKLAQIYHPDKRENKKFAEHKFKMLSEAYGILSDPDKRAQYDADNDVRKEKHNPSTGVYVEGVGDIADAISYSNGERHGVWEMHYKDGQVETGKFINGEKHGKWEIRFPSGDVHTGEYAKGKQHGRWEERFADGDVYIGMYSNGKRHGRWNLRSSDGNDFKGSYVRGKKQGSWVEKFADGRVFRGEYTSGKEHGEWELRFPKGDVYKGFYVKGKKHGAWEERFADGSLYFCRYDMGKEKETWKVSRQPEKNVALEPEKEAIWPWVALVFGLPSVLGFLLSRFIFG